MQANAMGINPQLNMANMVAMQGRNTNMFTQGSFTPSPTTVSSTLMRLVEPVFSVLIMLFVKKFLFFLSLYMQVYITHYDVAG